MAVINTGDMAYLLGWDDEKALVKVVSSKDTVWGRIHVVEFVEDSMHLDTPFKKGQLIGGDIWSEGSDKEYYSRNLIPLSPIEVIKAELDRKFSGPVYTANCVLVQTRQDGFTVWNVEYTRVSDNKRVPEFDGRIQRTNKGVTATI